MAEHSDPSTVPRIKPGPRLYPWEQWADGEWWLIREGEDFAVSRESFRATAFNYARRNGLVLATQLTDGGLFICFVKEDGK